MKQEQALELPKKKRDPSEGELDITPMIDITFLLLAFFVVVSRMDPQASVILPKASYSEAVSEKTAVLIVVKEDGDDAKIYMGRTMNDEDLVNATEPSAIEEIIRDYVEKDISANPTRDAILIKGEGNVRTRVIETVKKGVARSELGNERPLYTAIQEEK